MIDKAWGAVLSPKIIVTMAVLPAVACRDSPSGHTDDVVDPSATGSGAMSYILREHETTGGTNEYGPVQLAAGARSASWSGAKVDRAASPPALAPASDTGCAISTRDASSSALLLTLFALGAVIRRRRRTR